MVKFRLQSIHNLHLNEATCTTVYQTYLKDLGFLIKEMALEVKKKAIENGTDFSVGYMAGFHRIVYLTQQQAEAFGIPFEKIGLSGIDADED
ncbi:MAG: hypothetical protein CSA25_02180 [Desulfobacter postgatei]|uniref:Uncharacterized protein n=1 Tax=Desulfobacter postgatei TaxID=2293 RepID=A0A2G6MSI1_9BACT|nr:MAG: hypothetical protein CSA25_02180 [Desulfobacter postgatei]